jgi:hypothetical protein
MHDAAHDHEHDEDDDERIDEGRASADIESEQAEDRSDGDAAQAINATGDERCLVRRFPQHQAEAERHHETREVAAAHDGKLAR